MNFNFKNQYVNILAATLITVVSLFVVPKGYFSKYTLELIDKKKLIQGAERYYCDIDGDGKAETIKYEKIDAIGRVFEIDKSHVFLDNYNLPAGEFAVSLNLAFADNNNKGLKEFYFVSANENQAFLNILEYDTNINPHLNHRKIFLDSVSVYNNLPDVVNYKIQFTPDQKVVLNLQAGYSIQPRRMYSYDLKTNIAIKSPLMSIANSGFSIVTMDSNYFILPNDVHASGNSVSLQTIQAYENSTHKDTIELFEKHKHKAYQYGDFSAYTFLYNSKLDFVFPPVEYPGWTSSTISDYVKIDQQLYIVSMVRKSNDPSFGQKLNMMNLNGEIINSKPLAGNIWRFLEHPDTDKVYLCSGSKLLILNTDLDILREINFADGYRIIGFKDLNNDGRQELVTLHNNLMSVFQSDLKSSTSAPLNICNAEGERFTVFETFSNGGKAFLNFEIGETSLILKYTSNNKYYLKYLLYFLVFVFWNFALWAIMRLNSKRLKAENRKLENTVNQRTQDLKFKNKLLLDQKEELNVQAEELQTTNDHLNELSTFKEMMTNTVIHDLKNPLNTILHLTENEKISQSANNMLNLVLNILDIQKYENKKLSLYKTNVPLSEITAEAFQRVKVMMDARKLQFIETYEQTPVIFVDNDLMVRVLVNLLINAIKFSPLNGMISISAKQTVNEEFEIKVTDDGPGIPKDKLSKIFNMFEQAEERSSGNAKSSGMGLAFCKVAIEAHEGKIRAGNRKEGGAKFLIILPGKILKKHLGKNRPAEPNKKISVSAQEWQLIHPFIIRLKNLKVFQASEVLHILKDLNTDNENINLWRTRIKKAVFSGNQLWYNELLEINVESENE